MHISLIRLALKNMGRKRFRSMSIILAGALACGLIFAGTITVSAVGSGLEKGMARLGADIMVFPVGFEGSGAKILMGSEPSNFYMPEAKMNEVAAVKGVLRVSPQLYITSTKLICCTMPTVQLVGYDPETDFIITPWLGAVKKNPQSDTDIITLGANTMYAAEDAYMSFFGKRFQIKSVASETGLQFVDFSAFMTMDVARDMISISRTMSGEALKIGPDEISAIAVKVVSGEDVKQVAAAIVRNVPGVKTVVSQDLVSSVRSEVQGIQYGILTAGIICWLMTLFLMGLVFTMVVNERRKELGLLRSMGATRNHIVRLILSEAAILSGLSGLIGIAGGFWAIRYVKEILTLSAGTATIPFQLPSVQYIALSAFICGISILLSGVAMAIYPAICVGRIAPYDAIRKN